GETILPGRYRMAKGVENANTYRVGHPLAQRVLERGKELNPASAEVTFQYTESEKKISILESLTGHSGWIACSLLEVSALETEERLILVGLADDGTVLDETQCRRFFDLPATNGPNCDVPESISSTLGEAQIRRRKQLLEDFALRNGSWFETEMEKLDAWADDRRASLKAELKEIDDKLKDAKKASRLAPTLPEKLERQREARTLETRRDEAWRAFDAASREIDRKKDGLLDEISKRLEQKMEEKPLFTIRWSLT
ncbi:MAG: DEAD/DEAH box helicase, partial [bacterium]